VDALVALTLLSMTIGLGMAAASTAWKSAARAREVSRATALLRGVLETSPPGGEGVTDGLAWSVLERPLATPSTPIALCERTASAVGQRSGARYRLETTTICPDRAGA